MAVFDTGPAGDAPTDATPEERAQANRLINDLVTQRPATEPEHLARKAPIQAYRPGDDWDVFGWLTTAQPDRLRALFPYMPAAPHFAERYIFPPG